MKDSISISKIENHIALLETEKNVIEQLRQNLHSWIQEANSLNMDVNPLYKQLNFVSAIKDNVNRRVDWLNGIANEIKYIESKHSDSFEMLIDSIKTFTD